MKKHSIIGVYTDFKKCYFQNRIYQYILVNTSICIVYAPFKFINTPLVHFESFAFCLAPPTSLNSTLLTCMPVSLHSFFRCLNGQTRTTQAWLATPKLFNQVYTGIYLNKRDITEYRLEYSKDACRYLGLFGDHIVQSVLYCYTVTPRCCIKLTLSESTAKESCWLSTQDWRQCGKGTRLSTVVADTSMITLSTAYPSHFQYKCVYTYIYLYIAV